MAKSVIRIDEKVENKDRKFGAALEYYPIQVILENGDETWAMFTQDEIDRAMERAAKNKEDIPQSVWEKVFG